MRTIKDPATRREEILNAAFELFSKDGYQNTAVESIAQKAGIAKGSFYNYFKSKEDVSEAIIVRIAEDIVSNSKMILNNPNKTPKQRLVDFIEFAFQVGVERGIEINRLVAYENNPTVKAIYVCASDDGGRLLIPILCKTLEEGSSTGEFSMLDAYFSSAIIIGAMQKVYTAFIEVPHSDISKVKLYIYDFISKLLVTKF